jgi:hypothetical protein
MTWDAVLQEPGSAMAAAAARPGLARVLRILAPLVSLSVLTQAVFAGQGLFIDTDRIDLHGMLGNATLLLVLVQTGLVFAAGLRSQRRHRHLVLPAQPEGSAARDQHRQARAGRQQRGDLPAASTCSKLSRTRSSCLSAR